MKAFVTGGVDFLSRHIIRALLARGYEVRALTHSARDADSLRQLGAIPMPGDVTDPESMREGMAGCDVVFHIGPGQSIERDQDAALIVSGARNVLQLAFDLDIPRIVYSSSVGIYGDTRGEAVDETYFSEGPFPNERARMQWQAHYEVAMPLIARGAPLIIVIPGVAYGPGDTGWTADLMRRFYRGRLPAIPGSDTTFTFAHVEDIAEGHVLAAEKGRPGESYILAGPAVPLGEMVDFWSQLTGKRAPSARPPARLTPGLGTAVLGYELASMLGGTYIARSDKARNELGWRTRPLQTGMVETFEWIAASEPPDAGVREKQLIGIAALVALGVLLFWWLGRRRKDDTPA